MGKKKKGDYDMKKKFSALTALALTLAMILTAMLRRRRR